MNAPSGESTGYVKSAPVPVRTDITQFSVSAKNFYAAMKRHKKFLDAGKYYFTEEYNHCFVQGALRLTFMGSKNVVEMSSCSCDRKSNAISYSLFTRVPAKSLNLCENHSFVLSYRYVEGIFKALSKRGALNETLDWSFKFNDDGLVACVVIRSDRCVVRLAVFPEIVDGHIEYSVLSSNGVISLVDCGFDDVSLSVSVKSFRNQFKTEFKDEGFSIDLVGKGKGKGRRGESNIDESQLTSKGELKALEALKVVKKPVIYDENGEVHFKTDPRVISHIQSVIVGMFGSDTLNFTVKPSGVKGSQVFVSSSDWYAVFECPLVVG